MGVDGARPRVRIRRGRARGSDRCDRSLLTVVDIDGVPFSQAVMVLDLARRDARNVWQPELRGAVDQYVHG